MLKIGEVSKKTGVSIRSLHHYDEIGLLKPSAHSESGYRLYSKDDILRLQQVISLKQMGFPLKKIQLMLQNNEMNLQSTLELQLDFLQQRLSQQKQVYQQVKHVFDLLVKRSEVSLETIYETMEAIKVYEKYYTKEQIDDLKKRSFHMDEKKGDEYGKAWDDVFDNLKRLKAAGVPASDVKTKPYAEKARELINLFTGGNKGIEDSIQKMYDEEGGSKMLRNHGIEVTDAEYDYYEEALQTHVPK